MLFSKVIVAAAAFAVAQAAKFTNPAFNGITAGVAFNLTWTGATGPVTILLKNGDPLALKTVSTIASGLTGTSFIWSVPATLAADTYAIEIDDSTGPNYSPQFQLIGGVTSTSAAASSTTSSAASSSETSSTEVLSSTSHFGNSTTTATGSSSTAKSTSGSKTTGSGASSTGSKTSSATGASSSTSAPSSGGASGLASPLAFIFLAVGAILTLN